MKLFVLVVVVALATVGGSASANAAATSTTVPIDAIVDICTEPVQIDGTIHTVLQVNESSAGGFNLVSVSNPQGIAGFGLFSGTTYRATGVTQTVVTSNTASTFSFVDNFRLISAGSLANVDVHELMHVTVNADGVITASVDQLSVDCH